MFVPGQRFYSVGLRASEIVFLSAVRTPVGSFKGSLSSVSATELGSIAIKNAVEKSGVSKEAIDQVIMGNVLSAGIGQAPARIAALKAGLAESTVCTTVNKVCASGMKAITLASQSLQLGHSQFIVAGGMESMSNAPFYCTKAREGYNYGHQTLYDSIMLDGLTDGTHGLIMGACSELTAEKYQIDRNSQDDYAKRSYERAINAWKSGKFSDEVVPVAISGKKESITISEDEEYTKMDLSKIGTLRTVFRKENGTITAGNASKINDGASAVLMTTADNARSCSLQPMARILGYADAECAPQYFSTAPSLSIPKALEHAGVRLSDISLFEINEAFSAVILANQKILSLPMDKINIRGGAVALGHPIGSSGCRIVVSLIHQLQKGQLGCAAICNGGGGSTAIILERL